LTVARAAGPYISVTYCLTMRRVEARHVRTHRFTHDGDQRRGRRGRPIAIVKRRLFLVFQQP
jgi:hypothetical protein